MKSLTPVFKGTALIIILFALGLVVTALVESTGLDLYLAGLFYEQGGAHGGWVFARDVPWGGLYDYGEIPGIVVALACLGLSMAVRRGRVSRVYMRPCLVVILTVIIGPGFLVNWVLKSDWGRPRPVDVKMFGGSSDYREASDPGVPGGGKSFPCGHCSMAYSVAAVSAFYPYHPAVAVTALLGGIVFGTLTGVARMVQGGHFLTDVLWSGIIVFALIAALYYLILRVPQHAADERNREP